jgi:Na+/H+-dicarboxylate symporter
VGNSIATAVVAKWEGELLSEDAAEANLKKIDAEAASLAHPIPA